MNESQKTILRELERKVEIAIANKVIGYHVPTSTLMEFADLVENIKNNEQSTPIDTGLSSKT